MGIFSRLTGGDSEPTKSASAPEPAPAPAPRAAAPIPAPGPASRERTTIATGSKIVGDVVGSTELFVEGRVDGVIRVDHRVEIGPNGEVHGQVHAGSLRIGGKVYGNVSGKEKVEVLATGTLQGDVHSPKLSIVEGGFFKGNVDMSEVVDKNKAKAPAAAPGDDKTRPDAKAPEPKDDGKDRQGVIAPATAAPAAVAGPAGTVAPAANAAQHQGHGNSSHKGRNGK